MILGVLLLWLGSLVGVGFWQHGAGKVEEENAWNKEKASQEQKIASLQEAARKQEEATATAINEISASNEKDREDEKTKTNALIAKLKSNTLRLRDPGIRSSCSSVPSTSSGTTVNQQTCDGRLSTRASEFLLELTKRANQTRDQLTSCQQILKEDRNEKPSP